MIHVRVISVKVYLNIQPVLKQEVTSRLERLENDINQLTNPQV
jgi:hypothetical protein